MHVGNYEALVGQQPEFCSTAEPAPIQINETLGFVLGGVIVAGLAMIGFVLPCI
jgi:hypothetical protein